MARRLAFPYVQAQEQGEPVKPNDLQAAFALIGEFKRGQMAHGTQISDRQIALLERLCEDLLPTEKFSLEQLGTLIEKIARADSHWNNKTQLVIDEFYALREAGKGTQAQRLRRNFLVECPSAWYCGIVEAL